MASLRSHPLQERFLSEGAEYERLKKQAEARVARWEYSHSPRWHWNPVAVLGVNALSDPGRPASKTCFTYAFGFDERGRVVYLIEATLGATFEHFIYYDESGDESIPVATSHGRGNRFAFGNMSSAFDFKCAGDRVVSSREFDYNKNLLERCYEWAGDRLVSVRTSTNLGSPKEFTFDAGGQVTGRFHINRDGTRVPLLPDGTIPIPKGVTLKALAPGIRAGIVNQVAKTIRDCGITEPIYCALLVYDGEGNGVLPPQLALGIESERQKWIASAGESLPSYLWNPAEFTHFLEPHLELNFDQEFLQECEWLNNILDARASDAPARKLVNEAAEELATMDWSSSITTTPDFVVVAVDLEQGDLEKNMKKSVPRELLTRFRKEGYV
jgi:hypothetical protein